MVEDNRTWARLVKMACRVNPDDPDLAALQATKAFAEEHTTVYGRQAEQLEAGGGCGC
jgi:hypothetical protein